MMKYNFVYIYDRAIKQDGEIQLCIKQLWWKAIYKTNEIQLCLIMIELYIKQLMMKYNFV